MRFHDLTRTDIHILLGRVYHLTRTYLTRTNVHLTQTELRLSEMRCVELGRRSQLSSAFKRCSASSSLQCVTNEVAKPSPLGHSPPSEADPYVLPRKWALAST